MAEIVIIGAGLTGLSVAYHLEQQGFYDYKIFERESTVGGLCRSVEQDGFTFDYTGHLLHINNDYFHSFIEKTIRFEKLNTIKRRSFIYSQDRYTCYPYQTNLFGLPLDTITECIEGYITRPPARKKYASFHQWVLHSFGKGFGKHFFFPFQQKLFDYDLKKLSASWTGRFVPKTSLSELLEGAITNRGDKEIGYNPHFFYPRQGGINSWINTIHLHMKQPVHVGYDLQHVNLREKTVLFKNGAQETFKHLVTTIPLDCFLARLKETSDLSFHSAIPFLLCNSVVNINLGIKRETLQDKHWVYYPEKQYPFYRIGFPTCFSDRMSPPGYSSLYSECAHLRKPPRSINNLLRASRDAIKKCFNIHDAEIHTEKIICIDHAYVIYTPWRDRFLARILKKLSGYSLYSIGRYGAWKYSSMQEAVLDGKECAETLLRQCAPELRNQK